MLQTTKGEYLDLCRYPTKINRRKTGFLKASHAKPPALQGCGSFGSASKGESCAALPWVAGLEVKKGFSVVRAARPKRGPSKDTPNVTLRINSGMERKSKGETTVARVNL